jgi:Putative porin
MIATAVAATLSYLPAGGAHAASDDLAQIREQLQGLLQRVDKLEQENDTLKAENEQLKAEGDYLKAETRGLRKDAATQSVETGRVRGADWAGRIAVKGDLRYRHEQIEDDLSNNAGQDNARYRDRIRARLGFDAKVTDTVLVGLQLATGADDPRSSNQSLGGVNTRKSIGLDLAYLDWTFSNWGHLIAGKMKMPFVRPGNSLFYDGDINPEGIALTVSRGIWFSSAYNFWIEERSTAADSFIWGGQMGARLPIGNSNLMLAASYSDLVKGEGFRPFYNCTSLTVSAGTIGCANGNSVVLAGAGNPVLANDFKVAELAAEWNTTFGALPFQLWANAAENTAADDLNRAWGVGVLLGKASNYRTWEAGVGYQSIEKDALFGQMVDSDFNDGRTDGKGWILRAGYAPVRNLTMNATYFINERNMDIGTPSDYNRLQLDMNLKF